MSKPFPPPRVHVPRGVPHHVPHVHLTQVPHGEATVQVPQVPTLPGNTVTMSFLLYGLWKWKREAIHELRTKMCMTN